MPVEPVPGLYAPVPVVEPVPLWDEVKEVVECLVNPDEPLPGLEPEVPKVEVVAIPGFPSSCAPGPEGISLVEPSLMEDPRAPTLPCPGDEKVDEVCLVKPEPSEPVPAPEPMSLSEDVWLCLV